MAFGEQFEVERQPTDYCIGYVSSVGNLRDSKNNPINQVADITIQPVLSSRKREKGEKFYLVFRASWLQPNHSMDDVEKGGERFMYDNFFGRKGGKGIFQTLLSPEQREELGTMVQAGGVTPDQFVEFLNGALKNQIRGFTLEQGSDTEEVTDPATGETKKERYRTEYKGVGKFFGPEDVESIQGSFVKAVERAENESEKEQRQIKPSMKIHWELSDDSNPFDAVVESLSS